MATWQMPIGPSTSAPVAQLTRAKSRRFTFNLDTPSNAAFTIDGRTAEAAQVVELGTDLHLLRDGSALYTGRVMSTAEDFDDAGHSLQVATVDARGLLARRVLTADRTFTGDAAAVAQQMLSAAQSGANTSLNVAVPHLGTTGVSITRDSKAGASILGELSAVAGGETSGNAQSALFDWDISPGWLGGPGGGPTARLWTPRRGRDLTSTVVLDYTYRTRGGRLVPRSSPVAKVSRAFDPATYANVYAATGGTFKASYTFPAATAVSGFDTVRRGLEAEGNAAVVTSVAWDDKGTTTQLEDGPDPEADDTVTYGVEVPTMPVTLADGRTVWDVGTFGVYEAFSDVTSQAELSRLAAARAEDLRMVSPTYTVTLRNGWWEGPEHIWLGDTVRLILNTGRLNEDVALRVTSIDLDLGDNGEEQVALTVGPTRRSELSVLLAAQRRLAALERA